MVMGDLECSGSRVPLLRAEMVKPEDVDKVVFIVDD